MTVEATVSKLTYLCVWPHPSLPSASRRLVEVTTRKKSHMLMTCCGFPPPHTSAHDYTLAIGVVQICSGFHVRTLAFLTFRSLRRRPRGGGRGEGRARGGRRGRKKTPTAIRAAKRRSTVVHHADVLAGQISRHQESPQTNVHLINLAGSGGRGGRGDEPLLSPATLHPYQMSAAPATNAHLPQVLRPFPQPPLLLPLFPRNQEHIFVHTRMHSAYFCWPLAALSRWNLALLSY